MAPCLQALADSRSEAAQLKQSLEAAQASERAAKAEAEARAKELSAHNAELHKQIEKLAEESQKQVRVVTGGAASASLVA